MQCPVKRRGDWPARILAPLAAALFLCPPATATDLDRAPNIVIILADDLGYGDIHAYNEGSSLPTPHLDSLASEGVRFSDAHSPSAVCTPTRYGLLTGRYCWRTRLKRGVLGGYSEPLLESDRRTIGSMLQQQGYLTAAIGKWHLGMKMPMLAQDAATEKWDGDPGVDFAGRIVDSPMHHGFHHYFGVSASLDMAPYVFIRDDRFTQPPTLQQPAVPFPHFVRQGPRSEDFVIADVLDRLTQEAQAFLRKASRDERPFFLYLPLTGPHKPTQPHERFRGTTGLGEYGDFVAQVDWTVGQVLATLRELNEEQDTVVFFSSDNGSYMYRYDDPEAVDHVEDGSKQGFRSDRHRANGPLRGTKADIWEAGHRVPLLVRWPGQAPAGGVCSATVCLTDLFATCGEIAGAGLRQDEAEDSVSLLPLLRGETESRGAPVIHHSANGMFAIRDGDWKLVAGNGSGGREAPRGAPFEQPFQLYRLSDDLAESRDLAAEHPEIVTRLAAELERIRDAGRSVRRP